LHERLRILFVALTQSRPTLDFWLAGSRLLIGLFFIIASKGAHRRARDQLADVRQQTLAIVMTAVRLQRECGIPQAPQVPYRLTVCRASKAWILQYSLFKTSVSNLAVSPALRYCRHG
jgi:hypothetical protein